MPKVSLWCNWYKTVQATLYHNGIVCFVDNAKYQREARQPYIQWLITAKLFQKVHIVFNNPPTLFRVVCKNVNGETNDTRLYPNSISQIRPINQSLYGIKTAVAAIRLGNKLLGKYQHRNGIILPTEWLTPGPVKTQLVYVSLSRVIKLPPRNSFSIEQTE